MVYGEREWRDGQERRTGETYRSDGQKVGRIGEKDWTGKSEKRNQHERLIEGRRTEGGTDRRDGQEGRTE